VGASVSSRVGGSRDPGTINLAPRGVKFWTPIAGTTGSPWLGGPVRVSGARGAGKR
jgi:hypothetical protein